MAGLPLWGQGGVRCDSIVSYACVRARWACRMAIMINQTTSTVLCREAKVVHSIKLLCTCIGDATLGSPDHGMFDCLC
jgi:hypothetical protein